MAVPKYIVLNHTTGKTIISKDSPFDRSVSLTYGDTDTIKFQLVRTSDNGRGVTIEDATGLSCQIGLSDARGGLVITSGTAASPADATNTWTVVLPLNVAGVGAIATANGTKVFLEALVGAQRFTFEAVLYKQILTAATTDPEPPDVALGVNAAKLTYVPINAGASIARIEVDEATGARYRVVWRNGEYQGELIS